MPTKQSMFDIIKYCKDKQACAKVDYLKKATGGNDPNIPKAMRYAQYVRNASPKTIIENK
jgi:hypothetical protein